MCKCSKANRQLKTYQGYKFFLNSSYGGLRAMTKRRSQENVERSISMQIDLSVITWSKSNQCLQGK